MRQLLESKTAIITGASQLSKAITGRVLTVDNGAFM
jgi:hypothetical protein